MNPQKVGISTKKHRNSINEIGGLNQETCVGWGYLGGVKRCKKNRLIHSRNVKIRLENHPNFWPVIPIAMGPVRLSIASEYLGCSDHLGNIVGAESSKKWIIMGYVFFSCRVYCCSLFNAFFIIVDVLILFLHHGEIPIFEKPYIYIYVCVCVCVCDISQLQRQSILPYSLLYVVIIFVEIG